MFEVLLQRLEIALAAEGLVAHVDESFRQHELHLHRAGGLGAGGERRQRNECDELFHGTS
jgi:hypothetical protein